MTVINNQKPGVNHLIASLPDNPSKPDLDGSPRGLRSRSAMAQARVLFAMSEATTVLEMYLWQEMAVGAPESASLFAQWIVNTPPVRDRSFPGLNLIMARTPGFLLAAAQFEARLHTNLQAQYRSGRIDYRDLVTFPGPVRALGVPVAATELGVITARPLPSLEPPWVHLSLLRDRVAKICIGSMQGIHVWLRDFQAAGTPPSYRARLRYQIRDHFGVDDDDCEVSRHGLHGTPGQIAMWVLQHHRRPGHYPWVTVVDIERTIRGSLR